MRAGVRTVVVVVALLGATVPLAATPHARAASGFPHLTGPEFKALYYGLRPIPGTRPITTKPAIYGDAAADAHIQKLAEARGYRLQATPSVALQQYGGQLLTPAAANAFAAMNGAASAHGTPLQINSGYRSIDQQREIFRRHLGGYSAQQVASGQADRQIETVLAYHSIPGYSKHHTGVTMDMSNRGGTNGGFQSTAAYAWLSGDNFANAKRFGFIPSYPAGTSSQGPNPEPWEMVFVGTQSIRCAVRVIPVQDPAARSYCSLGTTTPGVTRAGSGLRWLLRNSSSSGVANIDVMYGHVDDRPVAGDWDRNGTDTLGVVRTNGSGLLWLLRSSNTSGVATLQASYGRSSDHPVVGDWDGDGDDTLGVVREVDGKLHWLLRDSTTSGVATTELVYGLAGDVPVVGDWDGNGTDTPGLRRGAMFYLRNHNTSGAAELTFGYGVATDVAVVGDWDGNGTDTPGVRRGTTFYLRNGNSGGAANLTFSYGIASDVPVMGNWDGS